MKYVREALTLESAIDIDAMLAAYYATQNGESGLPPYELNWDIYSNLQEAGSIVLLTARNESDTLVGLIMYMIVPHPHYMDLLVAECDIFVVSAHERGKGIGQKLIQYAEPYLVLTNAAKVVHREKFFHKANPLFPKLGYEAAEMCYVKEIR